MMKQFEKFLFILVCGSGLLLSTSYTCKNIAIETEVKLKEFRKSYKLTPIFSPTPSGFDSRSIYTPSVLFDGKKWLLWYNGASTWPESIGLAIHEGEDLGFEEKTAK